MKSLINNIVDEVKFENVDIQTLVNNISTSTKIQLQADFTLLVNLYRLKLKFDELNKKVPEVSPDQYREMCMYKGKRTAFTYFKLCKELFGLESKTVYKYNQFSRNFIENVEILGAENILNNPVYKHEIFYKMGISKLIELNDLLVWQVDQLISIGVLTDKLTFRQVRAIVKRVKELGQDKMQLKKEDFIGLDSEEEKEPKEKVEEPSFQIDNDNYTLFDFKAYSKSKLTLIAFDCYTNCIKLRKQIEKLKNKAGK